MFVWLEQISHLMGRFVLGFASDDFAAEASENLKKKGHFDSGMKVLAGFDHPILQVPLQPH